jgi:hypothetical protein
MEMLRSLNIPIPSYAQSSDSEQPAAKSLQPDKLTEKRGKKRKG